MILGCIADDFTGATDLANTLTRRGMHTVQTIGMPKGAAPDADAVVVALKSRTIPAAEAVAQSLAACRWLKAHGAKQIFFKYCSTFDSTDDGNIGPVADALLDELGADFTIACPAFPENGRTIYLGHLFVGGDLLSDSSMKNHPLTPMRDANLVRVLGRQTPHRVGLVPYKAVKQGAPAIAEAYSALKAQGIRHAIVDAVEEKDLENIGAASSALPLITGGSGVAIGLPQNYRTARLIPKREGASALHGVGGPGVVLSGSCSAATLGQVERFAAKHAARAIDPLALAREPEKTVAALLAWAGETLTSGPALIYASAPPDKVAAVQAQFGREKAGEMIEHAIAALAKGLAEKGVRRFVIAGGRNLGSSRLGAECRGARNRPADRAGRSRLPLLRIGALCAGAEIRQFRRSRLLRGSPGGAVMIESKARDFICEMGRSMFERRLTFGSSGNISMRIADGWLMTPTGSSLGRLDPARLSKLDDHGRLVDGDEPTKESFLHLAMYRERAKAGAVVHLHSTHSVAVSCLDCINHEDVLPPITAYYVMRVGKLPLIPYYAPGDKALGEAVGRAAANHNAVLLANHGPVVAGTSLSAAVDAIEELEETARLYLLLHGKPTRYLNEEQIADLKRRFPPPG